MPEPTNGEYLSAKNACGEKVLSDYVSLEGEARFQTSAELRAYQIYEIGVISAEKTEEFRNLKARVDECLRAAGYEPDPELFGVKDPPSSNSDAAAPEEIRAAVAEATCNAGLQVVQGMSNVQASFEAPLVAKHQSELNAEREKFAAAERRMDEFIRTHQ